MTLASESLPLSGLKVLSVEFYGAGPFCTQYLSTFGADVIKIENSTHLLIQKIQNLWLFPIN